MSTSPKSYVMFAPHSHESGDFFRIFGIHSFIYECAYNELMQLTVVVGADFAPMHAVAPSRGFPACYMQ